MVVHYLERGHSIKSTSNIDGDVYEDDRIYGRWLLILTNKIRGGTLHGIICL